MTKKIEESTNAGKPLPMQKWRNSLAEHAFLSFFIKAHPDASVEDLKRFSYWKNAAASLSRHDRITVLADNESWEAECRVESVTTGMGAEVRVVRVDERTPINSAVQPIDDGHYLQYQRGRGYCVIRRSDGYPIITGHASDQAARHQFLTEQTRSV